MYRLIGKSLVVPGACTLALIAALGAGDADAIDGAQDNGAARARTTEVDGTHTTRVDGGAAGAASIDVQTTIDGLEADTAPGPSFLAGSTVTVTHVLYNTGSAYLAQVELLGADSACVFPTSSLAGGEATLCTYDRTVTPGAHAEGIYAVASPIEGASHVSAARSVNYFGAAPAIHVKLYVEGEDADTEPGPYFPIHEPVELHYVITNTGNVQLFVEALSVECPAATLTPGEVYDCFRQELVGHDQNGITAIVRATPAGFPAVTDQDSAYYYGAAPGVHLDVFANGADAEGSPGPLLAAGGPIDWSFEVANTGNIPLMLTALRDTHVSMVTCPKISLDAYESMTCTGSSVAATGLQAGYALLVARFLGDITLTSDTPSFYFGAHAGIALETLTNGLDADSPPGPELTAGSQVNTTYLVRNTGNVPLTDVSVIDDHIGQIACSETVLAPGQMTVCVATGLVVPGAVSRSATASGVPPAGPIVNDSDPTNYTGLTYCLFDCDGNARTDLSDFAEFLRQFTGP